jgi:hypothetical protein
VIDNPDLGIGTRGHGDRFEADGHGGQVDQRIILFDLVDLEVIIGRVDGEEPLTARGQGEWADLPALEESESRRCGMGWGACDEAGK